jgi:hypothetical protein
MRDRETIDSELRRIASLRRSSRAKGGPLSAREIDALLDERLGHPVEVSDIGAVQAYEADIWSQFDKTDGITTQRRKGVLRRVGPFAALPLSLMAVAAAVAVIFAVHESHPAAEPPVDPPSSARPNPAPPKALAPPIDMVDTAFIDALKHVGVPVPSHEYVTTHGHAVCDFLAQQPNFPAVIDFVQQSSIWDAKQSVDFVAGAIVSYCPQYQLASPVDMQPGLQSTLPDLQRIQGDLQSIQGDLHGIRDHVEGIPGPP